MQSEDHALALLSRKTPLARDLRTILGAMQIATDAEQMGKLAEHVAKIVRRHHPNHVLPDEMTAYFAEIGNRRSKSVRTPRVW